MRIRRSLGPEEFGVSGFESRMATISTMSTLFCQFSCYEVHARALLHDIALYNELDANGLIGSVVIGIVDRRHHCLRVRRWLEGDPGDEPLRDVSDLCFVVYFR